MGWHNKEGLNVVSSQKGVPLMAMTWLHLVVPIQAREGRLCDVDLPAREEYKAEWELTSAAAQVLGESHQGHNRGYSARPRFLRFTHLCSNSKVTWEERTGRPRQAK